MPTSTLQETRSNFSNKAIIGPSDTATNAAQATLVGFSNDQAMLNWSSVHATAKVGFVLGIE